jgi:RimJ/RimL family protein N-acetyltransferase
VISAEAFADQPTLSGRRTRLVPLADTHFEGIRAMLTDPESMCLTGTRGWFTEEEVHQWLATRQDHHDRADWAILRVEDDVVLGEVVFTIWTSTATR